MTLTTGKTTPSAGETTPQHTRTIRCNAQNAPEFQQLIKNDPQLLALVQNLQAQNLFPGLRAMQITLTGSAEHCANGLAAWPPENAASGPASDQAGAKPC